MKKIIQSFVLFTLASSTTFANAVPQGFVYHGRAYSSDGVTPILSNSVDIQFDILAPNGCLLYEERQLNLDLSQTKGSISVQVGSELGSAIRTSNDPGLTMASIFSNDKSIPSSASCPSGYVGGSGDNRKLRVSLSTGAGFVLLTPDLPLTSVPNSLVAETIQGKKLSDLIQVSGSVIQSNLEKLTSGQDASLLHNHDSIYVKKTDAPIFSTAQVSAVGDSSSAVVNKDYVVNSISSAVQPLATTASVTAAVSGLATNSSVDSKISAATAPLATSASVDSKLATATAPLAKQLDLSTLSTQVQNLPTSATVDSKISSAITPLATSASVTAAVNGLASTSYVDGKVAPLATSSSVDSKIATAIAPLATTASVTSAVNSVSGNPSGTLISFAGANCPSGYLKADGASYAISTYSTLASTLYDSTSSSYIWGSSDSSHFNVPNMQGVFARGAGSQVIGGVTYSASLGSTQSDQMQGHKHQQQNYVPGNGGAGTSDTSVTGNFLLNNIGTPTTDGTNGTPRTGKETRPANISVNYCIKY